MQDNSPAPAARSRGRPRDPGLEDRVYRAASRIYAQQGWAGFNFDLIARESGVGKASLYGRWGSRAQLLRAVVEQRWKALSEIDSGNLATDLHDFAQLVMSMYLDTGGQLPMHMRRDIATYPEVAETVGPAMQDLTRRCRAIVRRAKARGELPQDMDTGLIPEIITATLEAYASSVGRISIGETGRRLELDPAIRKRVSDLVELILSGARQSPPAS